MDAATPLPSSPAVVAGPVAAQHGPSQTDPSWLPHRHQALARWPYDFPADELNALIDQQFAIGLEYGPRSQWRAWQQKRFAELIEWMTRSLHGQRWLGLSADGPGGRPLRDLPIMRRKDYRAAIETFAGAAPDAPPQHGEVNESATAGTTGAPMKLWTTAFANRMAQAQYMADHLRQNRKALVGRFTAPSAASDTPKALAQARSAAHRRTGVLTDSTGPHPGTHIRIPGDPFLGTMETLARYAAGATAAEHVQWLLDNPVDYLSVSTALWVAMLDAAPNAQPSRALRQVLTHGQRVDPVLRARTRSQWGAAIRDRYSAEEVGPIAFQCPSSDAYHHVAVGNVIVETVGADDKPAPAGELGRVLVTALHNYASPALRYDIGDHAALHSSCPGCSADVPSLSMLIGTARHMLRLPEGEYASGQVSGALWSACAPIAEHRLLQIAPDAVRVELVLQASQAEPLTDAQIRAVVQMLTGEVSKHFRYQCVQLAAIDWPVGPKRHPVECLLA